MKKVYILIIATLAVLKTMAQSAPGQAPGSFNLCNASNCTRANGVVCAAGSPNATIAFLEKQYVNNTGQGNNSNAVGAVWKFYNVASDNTTGIPVQVNATITIENTYLAELLDIDNDNAQDESGNNSTTMKNLFCPTISADRLLTGSNRAGYVQFRIRFYKNTLGGTSNKWDAKNYSELFKLSGLNYVHYDIDGVSGDGRDSYQLRETGVLNTTETRSTVTANANTELNAYSYTGDGAEWKGFMGSICNRDHTSQCSQVVASFALQGSYSSVVFRMGYNYTGSGNGLDDADIQDRLYASTFGCFTFPQPIALPVNLLSYTGSYTNNASLLSWETESEINFDHYEIERSSDGASYITVGSVKARHGETIMKYEFTDNLAPITGNSFYYRLKLVNADNLYKYSNVIILKRDGVNIGTISIVPNPVSVGNSATIRIMSKNNGSAEVRIIDLTGKIVLQQQSQVSPGTNSVLINNLNLLQSGIYAIQVLQNGQAGTAKLTIMR